MPQLSLYLDDAAMNLLRESARQEKTSLSRYAKRLIVERSSSSWPVSFWDTYGALDDDSFVAPAEIDPALDALRGSFDD